MSFRCYGRLFCHESTNKGVFDSTPGGGGSDNGSTGHSGDVSQISEQPRQVLIIVAINKDYK